MPRHRGRLVHLFFQTACRVEEDPSKMPIFRDPACGKIVPPLNTEIWCGDHYWQGSAGEYY